MNTTLTVDERQQRRLEQKWLEPSPGRRGSHTTARELQTCTPAEWSGSVGPGGGGPGGGGPGEGGPGEGGAVRMG